MDMSSKLPPMADRVLDEAEARAWDAYVRMTHAVMADIGRAVNEHTVLSVADHDVLCALACAPEDSMRLSALAGTMQWELSRLSHQLRRMERRGLVHRHTCVDDGRGVAYALTETGRRAISDAGPVHDLAVRRHMLAALSPAELDQMARLAEKILIWREQD